jgi:hypothetical protein
MLLDNLSGYCKSDAGPIALGREIGTENLIPKFARDSGAGIGDPELPGLPIFTGLGRECHRSAPGRCLNCIGEDCHEGLLQVAWIEGRLSRSIIPIDTNGDAP